MWEQVHGFFSEQIKSNMLLQGGLALSVLGGAAVVAKQWGLALWRLLLKKIVYTVEIPQETAVEMYRALILAFPKDVEGLNRFRFQKQVQLDQYRIPIGKFLIWRGLRPIYFIFSQEIVTAAVTADSMFKHTITITGFFAKRKVDAILDDSLRAYNEKNKPKKDTVNVYKMLPKDGIRYITTAKPKPIEDIVMKDGDMEKIMLTLDKWRSSEDRYVDLGLPYKLGLLFHGTPGTGKTSLAYSIALHLGFKIVRCSLRDIASEVDFNCQKTVYVFDDIDREMVDDKKTEITLENGVAGKNKGGSGIKLLLSLLDARLVTHNIVVVMSCNNIHALDEAIFRPGRVDMVMEFRPPTKEMAETFMTKFYGERVVLPKFFPGRSMSFYQTCCLRYMDSPKGAVKEACDEMSNINYNPKGLIENVPAKRMMAVEAA